MDHSPLRTQVERLGIRDERVLAAMGSVPRARFVPEAERPHALDDSPLPIGHQQTISQPYIVALMTELAHVGPGSRVLEVGTGSGYQTAILAALGAEVYSLEIIAPLASQAQALLAELGYGRVHVRHGDGYAGWPEEAPFDAILVTAAPPAVPKPLIDQLRIGGCLIVPVGRGQQDLLRITRTEQGTREEQIAGVRFVPMTGQAQQDPG